MLKDSIALIIRGKISKIHHRAFHETPLRKLTTTTTKKYIIYGQCKKLPPLFGCVTIFSGPFVPAATRHSIYISIIHSSVLDVFDDTNGGSQDTNTGEVQTVEVGWNTGAFLSPGNWSHFPARSAMSVSRSVSNVESLHFVYAAQTPKLWEATMMLSASFQCGARPLPHYLSSIWSLSINFPPLGSIKGESDKTPFSFW